MDAVKIRCRDLMVGDWITNRNGFPMQITNVGENYAYATFEGNEGDPWEFDDKDSEPYPIPLTPKILEKNEEVKSLTMFLKNEQGIDCLTLIYIPIINLYYVHELQRALRLCGLNEFADNFKI